MEFAIDCHSLGGPSTRSNPTKRSQGRGVGSDLGSNAEGHQLEPEYAVHSVVQGPRRIDNVSAYQVSAKSWRRAGVARGTVSSVDWRK